MKSSSNRNKWFLDSGCSRHMSGDKDIFSNFTPQDGGLVTFGDNSKGKILGVGKVGKEPFPCIENVLLVNGLKHNLLSISQLCDKGYKVVFQASSCSIEINGKILFVAKWNNNAYTLDFNDLLDQDIKCLSAINEIRWLWHRRLDMLVWI